MLRFQLHSFVRACVVVTICIVALLLSFTLFPSAQAKQPCLRIALPEAVSGVVGQDVYRAAMGEVGLCVDPLPMPNARALMAMRHRQIDGVFAMLDDFHQTVGTPVIRGSILVGNPDGVLVVKRGGPKTVSELTSEKIGVWLGATWAEELLEDHAHVVRVPGGPAIMKQMLLKARLDGLLLNTFSLGLVGGVPNGFVSIPVRNLQVYSWLRAEYAALMTKFDTGTARYLQKVTNWRRKPS